MEDAVQTSLAALQQALRDGRSAGEDAPALARRLAARAGAVPVYGRRPMRRALLQWVARESDRDGLIALDAYVQCGLGSATELEELMVEHCFSSRLVGAIRGAMGTLA